jgi:hypothetical protein
VEAKVIWVGETEVKVVIQSNGMEAIIPQVSPKCFKKDCFRLCIIVLARTLCLKVCCSVMEDGVGGNPSVLLLVCLLSVTVVAVCKQHAHTCAAWVRSR